MDTLISKVNIIYNYKVFPIFPLTNITCKVATVMYLVKLLNDLIKDNFTLIE